MRYALIFCVAAGLSLPTLAKGTSKATHPAPTAKNGARARQSPTQTQTAPTPSPQATVQTPVTPAIVQPTIPVRRVVAATPRPATTNAAPSEPQPPKKPIDPAQVTVPDEDPILEYQKRDAAKGFPEAQFALGMRYLIGNGVPQDEAKAKELIRAAADQGSERAREEMRQLREQQK